MQFLPGGEEPPCGAAAGAGFAALNSREGFATWLHFHDGGNEPTIHLPDQVEIFDGTTPAYLLKEAEKLKTGKY